ncbi:uncharacterized protein [Aegilops tauschii subsp. strangulata]|uniref:Myb/SANT-like domain-containing protein n=2 Tax=Aegilops tauschii TaxID=37682 RepID=A0A453B873_AEGTS|nr:L10-interacting MYB domain-containing protein-like [Aegilops tauschii subsp. strangulata]
MEEPKVKARWDREATRIFCECAAAQVRLGNRPTKALTPAGYKGLIAAFNAQTGRNYVQKQFKNRWDDMKAIYSAWVFYKNKATGLGWDDVKQTITADDDQWASLIAIHKPIKAFRHGPPDSLNELAIMFEKANVDGISSVMPGVDNEEVEETETEEDIHKLYEEENETQDPSPVQPSPAQPKRKRPKSAIPCSPSKFKKNNVPKDFKRFVDHVMQEDCAGQTSKTADNDDILAIMEEVAKCGASETSDEYYMATKLFAKPSNRNFFYAMKTNEGRLNWLKRQFDDRKK